MSLKKVKGRINELIDISVGLASGVINERVTSLIARAARTVSINPWACKLYNNSKPPKMKGMWKKAASSPRKFFSL